MTKMDSEVITLNVGGTKNIMTERDVLCLVQESRLAAYFSGVTEVKKINEECFLDRDGDTFLHVINYLRNNRELLPDFHDYNDEIQFYKELEHWKIPLKAGQIPKG